MSLDHSRILQPVTRAFDVVRVLANETLTLNEIGGRLGLVGRSVRRYIAVLQVSGVDIVAVPKGAAKAYRLDRRAWLCLLDLPGGGR